MNWAFQTPIRLEDTAPRHFEHVGYETGLALWRHRRMIAGLIALALLVAAVVLFASEKRYTATALVQIDFNRDDPAGGGRNAGLPLDASALVETEARFVRSRTIARQVAEQLAAEARAKPGIQTNEAGSEPAQIETQFQRLMRDLSVRNDSRSYLIEIGYTANTPEKAAEIANRFADTYLANRGETSSASARRAAEWYADQLAASRKSLEQAEASAAEYRRNTGIVETGTEGAALLQQRMREISSQANAATLARVNEESRLERARQTVAEGNIPSDIAALPQIQRLIESRETARRQASGLAAATGERHPAVVQARTLLQEAETRLQEEVTNALASLSEDVKNARRIEEELEAGAGKAKAALIDTRGREAELRTLQGRVEALRARLKSLNEGHMQARALSELKPVAAQIMAAAEPNRIPSGPRTGLILGLAGLAAAALGVVLTFLLERRDLGFRKEEDVLAATGCPCIGLLPAVQPGDARVNAATQRETLRAVIASQRLAEPGTAKVVLITSALPEQGKTQVLEGLARCLMEMGRRVLVVDASPRSEPDGTSKVALEDMIAGSVARKRALESGSQWTPVEMAPRNPLLRRRVPVAVGEPCHLSIVQRRGGLSDGATAFAPAALADLVAETRSAFDVVLIEAPPVLLAADALILAQFADIVLHAARWHDTPKASVGAALKRLCDGAVRVHGVILTQVDMVRYESFRSFRAPSSAYRVRKYYANFD
ncbi:GumC family protein [Bosea sp. (in: a-proteobacteria)]|uniref:GumC family protein n=1 Tax=Bosea sp. (in: a-proteobacteria) TaxID=1871050 RepID=UPI002FCB9D02